MSRKLMLLAAVPLLLAVPARAQSADQAPAGSGVETPPPPPAATDTQTPGVTTDTEGTVPSTDPEEPMPSDNSAATEQPAPDGEAAAAAKEIQLLTQESDDQVLVADIVGMDVVDASGKKIGTVSDVVLDKSGQVSGLVLSAGEMGLGGILGLGGKTVAISWQDVAAADDAESITVDLTEEQLTAAPEFQTEEEQLETQIQSAPTNYQ